jgi:regulator of protease activity HflC (stomatin/prohibitin superfamily)
MNGNIVTSIGFITLILLTIFKGARLVPQGEKHIVQRLGRFFCTLEPGLTFIIPYVDSVAYRVTTKDIVLDIPSQEVISKDNAVLVTNAVGFINIVSPEKAVYGIENYEIAIKNLIQTGLRSILGEMTLDEALSSRDSIKAKLKESISDDISDWGIILKTVEIQDINPSETMQAAMEEQASAERQRRARVTRAEGEKESSIIEAEGRLEASRKDAESRIVLANASKESIDRITSAITGNELPAQFILGEKYIQSITKLSESPNAKFVLLPSDLKNTLKGLLNK